MNPDALLRIRLLTSAEGGRASAIEGEHYGCPVLVNDGGFDCRFVPQASARFELGKTYEIGVKFLNPELALRQIKDGTVVSLWEGKIIGVGEVVKVFTEQQ